MINKIKKYLKKQAFAPGLISLLINPFYFARLGLYQNIKLFSHYISGKILDVGCGQKPYKSLFSFKEYIGMDVDQSGHSHKNEDVDVFYDGKTFPFENESFDSAISNQVLEHIFNPDEHLKEINRVLRNGGKLLLSVPFVWDEHEQPYDYARYSSFGLEYLLKNNGFEIIESKKSISDVRVIFQMTNAYIYKKTLCLRKGYFKHIVTVIFNAPFNIIGTLVNLILPDNRDFYLDNIIVAVKVK